MAQVDVRELETSLYLLESRLPSKDESVGIAVSADSQCQPVGRQGHVVGARLVAREWLRCAEDERSLTLNLPPSDYDYLVRIHMIGEQEMMRVVSSGALEVGMIDNWLGVWRRRNAAAPRNETT